MRRSTKKLAHLREPGRPDPAMLAGLPFVSRAGRFQAAMAPPLRKRSKTGRFCPRKARKAKAKVKKRKGGR